MWERYPSRYDFTKWVVTIQSQSEGRRFDGTLKHKHRYRPSLKKNKR
jgi:hypothetical protein